MPCTKVGTEKRLPLLGTDDREKHPSIHRPWAAVRKQATQHAVDGKSHGRKSESQGPAKDEQSMNLETSGVKTCSEKLMDKVVRNWVACKTRAEAKASWPQGLAVGSRGRLWTLAGRRNTKKSKKPSMVTCHRGICCTVQIVTALCLFPNALL